MLNVLLNLINAEQLLYMVVDNSRQTLPRGDRSNPNMLYSGVTRGVRLPPPVQQGAPSKTSTTLTNMPLIVMVDRK